MIKLQTFDSLFPRLDYDIFAKNHSRMPTVIAFSRPNDVGSHAHTKGVYYNLPLFHGIFVDPGLELGGGLLAKYQ